MFRVLRTLSENKQQAFVLASVIGVAGSAYRHEGAKMLIGSDGTVHGMITAGCLETDLAHHAQEIFGHQTTKLVTYDLRAEDDLGWGRGAGCNGMIEVYLEWVQWGPVWLQIQEWLDAGEQVMMLTKIEEGKRPSRVFSKTCGEYLLDGEREIEWETFQPIFRRFSNTSPLIQRTGHFLLERYLPREILYIFGAGQDAEPLVQLAAQLDFDIRIVDPRENRCNKAHFPMADQCIVEHPNQFIHTQSIPRESYVVIMTHSFQWDQVLLFHFLNTPPRYLGILGTRNRTERLLNNSPIPEWVHSPIGLTIYAQGQNEISISIMAEIVMVRNSLHKLNVCD